MRALKIRILDALGCAIAALNTETMRTIRDHVDELGGSPLCTLIGGGMSAPDRAAFYNGALVRYLDFNDSYFAKGETCHPSDNFSSVLAACEYANCTGRRLLTALAVAYHVQCRLSDAAPVRAKGFDHVVQGAYALAAGAAKALDLEASLTGNAIGICGTAFNALRVTRTGVLSNWKGLAYPNAAFACTHAVLLAKRGITGPHEVFEGDKGFMATISGPFELDWSQEGVDRVLRTFVKKYNAEIHSQSAIEALLELKCQYDLTLGDIYRIDVETFDVAFNIIGGGEEGDKKNVRTKEQADHSLPYILAVAMADGTVGPAQYAPERIRQSDVQSLLQRISIRPSVEFSARFPTEMPSRVRITLKDGRILVAEKRDYEGFLNSPMSWQSAMQKFKALSEPLAGIRLTQEIAEAVNTLDSIEIRDKLFVALIVSLQWARISTACCLAWRQYRNRTQHEHCRNARFHRGVPQRTSRCGLTKRVVSLSTKQSSVLRLGARRREPSMMTS